MENRTPEYILRADIKKILQEKIQEGNAGKTNGKYGKKVIPLKGNYDAVSKNGDTLELSEKGKKLVFSIKNSSSPPT